MKIIPLLCALALSACGASSAPPTAEGYVSVVDAPNLIARQGPAGPVEPLYGPEQTMSGIYLTRFERAEFSGCWLSMTAQAVAEFRRRFPPDSADSPMRGRRYQIEIVGRRTVDGSNRDGPERYGHLNGWPCQIEARQITSAQVIGPA